MRCLLVVATLALAGATPSLADDAEAAPALPGRSETPRKASPFLCAAYDSMGGPGFALGVSLPLGSRSSTRRLAVGYSAHFAEVAAPTMYPYYGDGSGTPVVYSARRRNVTYTYASLIFESRSPALRPYGGVSLGMRHDYSSGSLRRTQGGAQGGAVGDFATSDTVAVAQAVFGLVLGRGRGAPFVEVAGGKQVRVSGGLRF